MFSEKAIYHVEDSNVGQRVETMQRKGMLLETADGLDFCKQHVFDDMVGRERANKLSLV